MREQELLMQQALKDQEEHMSRNIRDSRERSRHFEDLIERPRDVRHFDDTSRHLGDYHETSRHFRNSHERSRYEGSHIRTRRSQSRSLEDQYPRGYEGIREYSREGSRDYSREGSRDDRDSSFRTLDNSKTKVSQEERESAFERLGGKVSIKSRLGGSFARYVLRIRDQPFNTG